MGKSTLMMKYCFCYPRGNSSFYTMVAPLNLSSKQVKERAINEYLSGVHPKHKDSEDVKLFQNRLYHAYIYVYLDEIELLNNMGSTED